MAREIRARYEKGRLELLERVDLREGEEITIVIEETPRVGLGREAFIQAARAWKGTLDFDAYLADLYAARRDTGRSVIL